jgi:hypothetical protein
MAWNSGNCPWDISIAELRRVMREKIGLNDFLTLNRSAWTKYDLKPYADRARQWAAQIKLLLNFSITPLMSDVQIVHQLLSQMGISIASKWSRSHPGHEGEKLHLYSLDVKAWQPMIDILERRKARREGLQAAWNAAETFGSPPRKGILTRGGDPKPAHPQTQEDSGVDADEAFSAKSCANLSKQHRRAKQNFL